MAIALPTMVPLTRESAPDLFRLTRQGALTVEVTIKPGQEASLETLLATINAGIKGVNPLPFASLGTVHFMRWVILDANPKKNLPASLVMSTNYDGSEPAHLEELMEQAGAILDEIYSHCEGYDATNLRQYLRKHRVSYAAFYVGTTGRSVNLIKKEAELREAIQRYLDDPKMREGSPTDIRDRIIQFVKNDPNLRWACSPPTVWAWHVFNYSLPVLVILAYLAAWALLSFLIPHPWWWFPLGTLLAVGVPVVVLGALVWAQEKRDAVDPPTSSAEGVAILAEQEDEVVQNQLTHLSDIKPQWFRPIALWVVLRLINVLARYLFIRGALGGIPSIHFARWVIIDGRRLLFFSNYDGSWVNYLGDFIDKAAPGLTAIWSNTEGCPKAEGFVSAGAKDEQRFKAWTRNHQIFTDVWYSAYPDLTVDNINNNSFIRIGLAGKPSLQKTTDWLSRF